MTEKTLENRPGLTIIVVTYRRIEALYASLDALLSQDLRGLRSELIVVNNDAEAHLRPSRWTKLGRLFRANSHIKLVNTRNDWMSIIRYGMVFMAEFDTVLTLDDDIIFMDQDIVCDMYQTLMGLQGHDIVSSWNTIWTKWTATELHYASASFWMPELTQLTKTDTCGSGISMFNKDLICGSDGWRYLLPRDHLATSDMALGLLSNLLWNGTTYAMPMFGRVDFHREFQKNALHRKPDFYPSRLAMYKQMLNHGYKPVITREPYADDSPETLLIRQQEPKVRGW